MTSDNTPGTRTLSLSFSFSLMCSLRGNWNAFGFGFHHIRLQTSSSSVLNSLCYYTRRQVPESRYCYTNALTGSVSTVYRARKCACRDPASASAWWSPTGRRMQVTPNPSLSLSTTMRKRPVSSKATASSEKSHHFDETLNSATTIRHGHEHIHEHDEHSHTHGVFGFGSHDHNNHEHQRGDAEKFMETLKGGGEPFFPNPKKKTSIYIYIYLLSR